MEHKEHTQPTGGSDGHGGGGSSHVGERAGSHVAEGRVKEI